jgi:hypothetical protein
MLLQKTARFQDIKQAGRLSPAGRRSEILAQKDPGQAGMTEKTDN